MNSLHEHLYDTAMVDWLFRKPLKLLLKKNGHSTSSDLFVAEITKILSATYKIILAQRQSYIFLVGGQALPLSNYSGDIDLWINSDRDPSLIKELCYHVFSSIKSNISYLVDAGLSLHIIHISNSESIEITCSKSNMQEGTNKIKVYAVNSKRNLRTKCVDLFETCGGVSQFISRIQKSESEYPYDRAAYFPKGAIRPSLSVPTVRYFHPLPPSN